MGQESRLLEFFHCNTLDRSFLIIFWRQIFILITTYKYLYLFPNGEFLRTYRVVPLSLSGSLFLVLLVLDFYQPTNRDLYLVVAVAVAVAVGRIFG